MLPSFCLSLILSTSITITVMHGYIFILCHYFVLCGTRTGSIFPVRVVNYFTGYAILLRTGVKIFIKSNLYLTNVYRFFMQGMFCVFVYVNQQFESHVGEIVWIFHVGQIRYLNVSRVIYRRMKKKNTVQMISHPHTHLRHSNFRLLSLTLQQMQE